MKKNGPAIAVILPGIGYTCDRPLLYYSGKLARSLGWETVPVPYGGFPPKIRGDRELLTQSAGIALSRTEQALKNIDWKRYARVCFISKSIGTAAAAAYAADRGIDCRHVLFTPLEETFTRPIRRAAAFHGTADPWADTARIGSLCREARIPLYITQNADHSLETGDIALDIRNLQTVMERVRAFLELPDGDELTGGSA